MPARVEPVIALLEKLGVPIDAQLLDLALIHRSYSYENGQIPHNERLEFLGDAVLGVVVTEYLYRTFPDLPEGRLAKLRAAVVSTTSLADVARQLGIGKMIKLGKGELATKGNNKTSILADTMEALIGACYLTSEEGARRFIGHIFQPLVDRAATLGAGLDWKTSLQELASAAGLDLPEYLLTTTGPDHDKHFTARVLLNGVEYPAGEGSSKKHAEQQAAKNAFHALRCQYPDVEIAEETALLPADARTA